MQGQLVMFDQVKDIINNIDPSQLIKNESLLCTQEYIGEQTVSIVEVKLAFIQQTENGRPKVGGDAETSRADGVVNPQ